MRDTRLAIAFLLITLLPFAFVNASILSTANFNLDFTSNKQLTLVLDSDSEITFNVTSGNLTGAGYLSMSDYKGNFIVYPNSTGELQITSTNSSVIVLVDNVEEDMPYSFNSGVSFTVSWSTEAENTFELGVAVGFIACIIVAAVVFAIFYARHNKNE